MQAEKIQAEKIQAEKIQAGPMQVGVFAKTFAGTDPHAVLSACREAGFDCVQYNMACSGLAALPGSIPKTSASKLTAAMHATGIGIAALSATYNMTDPDPDRRQAGRASFSMLADFAVAIGCPMLTVCSGSLDAEDKWRHHPQNDAPESWQDMCREFESLCAIAEARDLLIGVEPEPANIVSSSARAANLLADFAGSPIRIILDPANLIEGIPPERHRPTIDEAFDRLGPMIALAHAKDRFADGRVAPAGKGVVDWPHVLHRLAKCGFGGPVIAHGMTADEAADVAAFLAAQLRQAGS